MRVSSGSKTSDAACVDRWHSACTKKGFQAVGSGSMLPQTSVGCTCFSSLSLAVGHDFHFSSKSNIITHDRTTLEDWSFGAIVVGNFVHVAKSGTAVKAKAGWRLMSSQAKITQSDGELLRVF